MSTSAARKSWRREVKKIRRKRIRKSAAQLRHLITAPAQVPLSPASLTRLAEDRTAALLAEEHSLQLAEQERAEQHRLWLDYDRRCQAAWSERQTKRELAEQQKLAERDRIRAEFEANERRHEERRHERIRIAAERRRLFDELQLRVEAYLLRQGPVPDELRQPIESNAAGELCRMFARIGSCRFGAKCSRNHQRPGISRLLLFAHLFADAVRSRQPPLDWADLDEPVPDRWQQVYVEFFEDFVPELERLGGAVTQFRVCRNRGAHLAGNVLVEFDTERNALRALRQLTGRYYSGCMLRPEFGRIESWKSAVCGQSIVNKCPKSIECNFLHVFRNPGKRFPFVNVPPIGIRAAYVTKDVDRSSMPLKWDDLDDLENKRKKQTVSKPKDNWRWSESPSPGKSSRSKRPDDHHNRERRSTTRSHREDATPQRSHPKSPERRHRSRSSSANRDNRVPSTSRGSHKTSTRRVESSARKSCRRSRSKSKSRNPRSSRHNCISRSQRSRSRSTSRSLSRSADRDDRGISTTTRGHGKSRTRTSHSSVRKRSRHSRSRSKSRKPHSSRRCSSSRSRRSRSTSKSVK